MKNLYLCGDIHGEWRSFVWNAVERYKINDASIIIVGDFGVGFDGQLLRDIERTERKLEKHNIKVYAVRGNHDDPDYFDGRKLSEHVTLLKDYSETEIEGFNVLPIGGANSVDIEDRLKTNTLWERQKVDKKCWWPGEDVKRVEINILPLKTDLIVSHEAPMAFEPTPRRPEICPYEQYKRILETRRYLNEILDNVNTPYWYFGHYHRSIIGSFAKTQYRGLNIMEFFLFPECYKED